MNAIFSSKLFKASSRKEKIRAAVSNPINAELVTQLQEYLDEEVTPKGSEQDTEISDTEYRAMDASDAEKVDSGRPISSLHSAPPFRASSSNDTTSTEDSPEDPISEDTSNESDGEVNESTQIKSPYSISASSTLDSSCLMSNIVEQINGLLNSRQDTCGVSRVISKQNELWIYYDDKINLNNMMGPVISLLNAANYSYLDFNRLARTDNAIVFEIITADSVSLKPIGGADEK